MNQEQLKQIMEISVKMSVGNFNNKELAAANVALITWERVDKMNLGYEKLFNHLLINKDGTPKVDLDILLGYINNEINSRIKNGTWK